MAVCVDNGVEYVTFDKAFDNLALVVGDEVIVVGTKTNDKFEAKAYQNHPGRGVAKARDNQAKAQ